MGRKDSGRHGCNEPSDRTMDQSATSASEVIHPAGVSEHGNIASPSENYSTRGIEMATLGKLMDASSTRHDNWGLARRGS